MGLLVREVIRRGVRQCGVQGREGSGWLEVKGKSREEGFNSHF